MHFSWSREEKENIPVSKLNTQKGRRKRVTMLLILLFLI